MKGYFIHVHLIELEYGKGDMKEFHVIRCTCH